MLLTEEQQQLIEEVEQIDSELADKLYIQFVTLARKVIQYKEYLENKLNIKLTKEEG